MWGMFMRVTGGISLVDGGRCPEVAGALVCGTMPVLMIGGVRSVEMAKQESAFPYYFHMPVCIAYPTIVALLPHGAHDALESTIE